MSGEGTTTLNIYLVKPGINPTDAFSGKLGPPLDVTVGGNVIGSLRPYQSVSKAPAWIRLFPEQKATLSELMSGGTGGILHVANTQFLLSFGFASQQIDKSAIEPDFGLRVTLNSVDPKRLRSVDAFTPDALGRQTRTQASRMGSIPEFGLNVDRDLLRTVEGEPTDTSLGQRMSGKDNLVVNVAVDLATLPALLKRYAAQAGATTYQANFAWIDKVREVREKAKIAKLEARLVEQFQTGVFEKTWMAVPQIVEWDKIKGFRYGAGIKSPLAHDVHVKDLRASFRDPSKITLDQLRKPVKAYPDDTNPHSSYDWSAHSALYCELELDNEVFLLTNGKWFRIASDFVEEVTQAIQEIPEKQTLPDFDHKDEGEYNKAVAQDSAGHFVLLDRDMVQIGGNHSQVECCDLLGQDGRMIHVKRYGGSGVLSHLFQQGVNAANLWTVHSGFRNKVNDKLPDTHKLSNPSADVDRTKYKIVFAITTQKDQPLWRSLPFFSKLTLRNARDQIRAFGYEVELERIADRTGTA